MTPTHLHTRAVIKLTPLEAGEDVREFLQGLVTNDVSGDLPVYTALLSAQGKAMFDFLVWSGEAEGELWLDCLAETAQDLAKRLSLYRLRRKIAIAVEPELAAHWSATPRDGAAPDPRLPELGFRWIAHPGSPDDGSAEIEYTTNRLALGVPEGADLTDILWLETNAVELNGVSFEKGCYVGQENTARMNWRQKVNRRLVVVELEASDEKRRRNVYSEYGYAVDHLRVDSLDASALPDWQRAAISG